MLAKCCLFSYEDKVYIVHLCGPGLSTITIIVLKADRKTQKAWQLVPRSGKLIYFIVRVSICGVSWVVEGYEEKKFFEATTEL